MTHIETILLIVGALALITGLLPTLFSRRRRRASVAKATDAASLASRASASTKSASVPVSLPHLSQIEFARCLASLEARAGHRLQNLSTVWTRARDANIQAKREAEIARVVDRQQRFSGYSKDLESATNRLDVVLEQLLKVTTLCGSLWQTLKEQDLGLTGGDEEAYSVDEVIAALLREELTDRQWQQQAVSRRIELESRSHYREALQKLDDRERRRSRAADARTKFETLKPAGAYDGFDSTNYNDCFSGKNGRRASMPGFLRRATTGLAGCWPRYVAEPSAASRPQLPFHFDVAKATKRPLQSSQIYRLYGQDCRTLAAAARDTTGDGDVLWVELSQRARGTTATMTDVASADLSLAR